MDKQVKKMRKRAIEAFDSNSQTNEYLDVDYFIDDEARKVLGLPPRPTGILPYVGWMLDTNVASSAPTKTSQAGFVLIKKYEGLRTNAYLCPANVWTIGYGHTKGVKQGQMISHLEAEKLLKEDLAIYEKAVVRLITVPLNQNQFDALVSLVFNIGVGAFSNSTLLKLLNYQDYGKAGSEFSRWVRGGGKILPGLVNRRKDEHDLFVKQ